MCPEFLAHLDRQRPPPAEFRHHTPRTPGQSRTSFVIPPDTDTDSSSDTGPTVRWRLNPNPPDSLFKYNDDAAMNAALAQSSSAAAASSYTTAESYFVDEPDPEPEPEGP